MSLVVTISTKTMLFVPLFVTMVFSRTSQKEASKKMPVTPIEAHMSSATIPIATFFLLDTLIHADSVGVISQHFHHNLRFRAESFPKVFRQRLQALSPSFHLHLLQGVDSTYQEFDLGLRYRYCNPILLSA